MLQTLPLQGLLLQSVNGFKMGDKLRVGRLGQGSRLLSLPVWYFVHRSHHGPSEALRTLLTLQAATQHAAVQTTTHPTTDFLASTSQRDRLLCSQTCQKAASVLQRTENIQI